MFLCDSLIKNLVIGIHEASPVLRVIHRELPSITYLNTAGTAVSCRPHWSHSAPVVTVTVARQLIVATNTDSKSDVLTAHTALLRII